MKIEFGVSNHWEQERRPVAFNCYSWLRQYNIHRSVYEVNRFAIAFMCQLKFNKEWNRDGQIACFLFVFNCSC